MSYAPSDAAGKGTARYPRQASNAMAARLAAFQQSASDDGSVPEPLRGGALPQPPGAIAMAAASDVRRDPANRRPVTAEAATVASAGEHEAVRQLHQADVARLTMMQAVQQKRLALAMAEAERAGEESEQETAKATEKPAFASSFASQLRCKRSKPSRRLSSRNSRLVKWHSSHWPPCKRSMPPKRLSLRSLQRP